MVEQWQIRVREVVWRATEGGKQVLYVNVAAEQGYPIDMVRIRRRAHSMSVKYLNVGIELRFM